MSVSDEMMGSHCGREEDGGGDDINDGHGDVGRGGKEDGGGDDDDIIGDEDYRREKNGVARSRVGGVMGWERDRGGVVAEEFDGGDHKT